MLTSMTYCIPPMRCFTISYQRREIGLARCWIERHPNLMTGNYEELKDKVQLNSRFGSVGGLALAAEEAFNGKDLVLRGPTPSCV